MVSRYGEQFVNYVKNYETTKGETYHKFEFDNGCIVLVMSGKGRFFCVAGIDIMKRVSTLSSEKEVTRFLKEAMNM